MFGLFRSSRPRHHRRTPASPLRARLQLEDLAGRITPSGPGDPGDTGGPPLIMDAPPQIIDFDVVDIGNGQWRVSGEVQDEEPGNLTITLGGSIDSVSGSTCTTLVDGTFSMIVVVTSSGMIIPHTVDGAGHGSVDDPSKTISI